MILELTNGRLDLDEGVYHRTGAGPERLTDIERRFLRYLGERLGQPVSREELQREVWGYRAGVLSRTVFTTVGRIRAKIEPDPTRPRHLLTAAGEGYTLALVRPARARRGTPSPPPAARLVGREAALAELEELVDRARLVSLLGPGGVGKTRLALELLARREGVFVALEPVDELGRVPAAVAAALGSNLAGRGDGWTELGDAVGDESMWLILDNAEHLPGLAERLHDWLGACPGLRLLVTTRVRLGLRLETGVVLEPLGEHDAGALLMEHAARVRPGWSPDGPDRARLAALCTRLGGSPLALELAASWLRLLEPADLLAELERTGGLMALDRDVPARHQSMEVALAASWRLLAPQAVAVLEALSTFCTPFDRAAAAAVAGADLLTLGQLVDASMVHRVGARFDLHPLVRADARARLAAAPQGAVEAAQRHASWFLGNPEVGAVEDVLAAWDHAVRCRDADLLADSAYRLYGYLDRRNRHEDLIRALSRAGEAVDVLGVRAALRLLGAGAGAAAPGDLRALVAALDALAPALRAPAQVHAAIAAQLAGDHALAVELAARAEHDAGGDPGLVAFARSVAGTAWMRAGQLDRARGCLRASIEVSGDDRLVGRPMVHLGEVELAAGDPTEAREVLACALDHCRIANDRTFATHALGRLGQALAALGDDPVPAWLESLDHAHAARLPRVWWSVALAGLGDRWASAGRIDGVVLLAAAGAGPSMDPPRTAEVLLQAHRGDFPPTSWATATRRGRTMADADVLMLVRTEDDGGDRL